MQVYRVTGYVTLSRAHSSFTGARLVTAEAAGQELLGKPAAADGDTCVVWDDLGASAGSMIAVSDGAEAAQPFRPELKPVDAYCAAILDTIYIDPLVLKQIE